MNKPSTSERIDAARTHLSQVRILVDCLRQDHPSDSNLETAMGLIRMAATSLRYFHDTQAADAERHLALAEVERIPFEEEAG